MHKAEPEWDTSQHHDWCKHCNVGVKSVPGGQGKTWVHEDTGAVIGPDQVKVAH